MSPNLFVDQANKKKKKKMKKKKKVYLINKIVGIKIMIIKTIKIRISYWKSA